MYIDVIFLVGWVGRWLGGSENDPSPRKASSLSMLEPSFSLSGVQGLCKKIKEKEDTETDRQT